MSSQATITGEVPCLWSLCLLESNEVCVLENLLLQAVLQTLTNEEVRGRTPPCHHERDDIRSLSRSSWLLGAEVVVRGSEPTKHLSASLVRDVPTLMIRCARLLRGNVPPFQRSA